VFLKCLSILVSSRTPNCFILNVLYLGEALPQLVLSSIFITYNGGPARHPISVTSAFFSANSFIYGFLISVEAFRKNRKEKMALHYRATLGMPYGPSPTKEQNVVEMIAETVPENNDDPPEEQTKIKEESDDAKLVIVI
jgi:hypothetical protein